MSFSFQCPVCKSVREAADNLYGKTVRCADCDNFVNVDDSTIVQSPPGTSSPDNPYAVGSEEPGIQIDDQFSLAEPTEVSDGSSTNYQEIADAVTPKPTPVVHTGTAKPVGPPGDREAWKGGDETQGQSDGSGGDDGDAGFEQFDMPKGESRIDEEMDMTPMVDVTFLLLIFFMVTASFTLQKSMDLPTKTQDEPSPNVVVDFEDNPEYVSVFISPYNEYRVRTSEYDWEDAPNRHELRVRLTDALQAQSKPEKMLIMAHADCFHDKVIQAMDIGIELRYKIQVIMTEEEF